MNAFDVIVVGAGAAGIGATRRLRNAGHSVLVLEARSRIGGRAWTRLSEEGLALDMGAAWLHSADTNPLVKLARAAEARIDDTPCDLTLSSNERTMEPERLAAWRSYRSAFDREIERCGELGKDISTAECAGPDEPWRTLLDAHVCAMAGAPLSAISALDFARYAGSAIDWRLPEGYGALLERLAQGLPIRTSAEVERIDHRGEEIAVSGSFGKLSARRVVITLPTSLLADEAICFQPELPADKLTAAAQLPLGSVGKLFLRIDGAALGDCRGDYFTGGLGDFTGDLGDLTGSLGNFTGSLGNFTGSLKEPRTAFYLVRPFGLPIVEVYTGGTLHEDLERAGPEAWSSFAVEQLAALFGADVRSRLSPIYASSWRSDPWTRGGYSNAVPGGADARSALAHPVEGLLFFAGEATSPDHMATVHGAFTSGERAANEAIASLNSK